MHLDLPKSFPDPKNQVLRRYLWKLISAQICVRPSVGHSWGDGGPPGEWDFVKKKHGINQDCFQCHCYRSNFSKNFAQNKLKVECQSLWYLTRRNSGKNIFSHHLTAITPQVQRELFWRSAWKHVDGLLPKFIRSWSQVPVHFYALG